MAKQIVKCHSKTVRNKLGMIHRRLRGELFKLFLRARYGSGCDVMERDWDNLILLDACRYDYFKQYTSFNGDISRIVSKGNDSWSFIQNNFVDNEFHDTVYITANPFSERLDQDVFFTVETVLDRWDPSIGTVHPKDVTKVAVDVSEKYPHKRLLVHYMQPHLPHLGSIAKKYSEEFNIKGFSGPIKEFEELNEGVKLWKLYRRGHITKNELRESYKQTLQITETYVKKLLKELNGKSVISSDHGENLGENKYGTTLLGHGYENESKECRFVPWLELPHNDRRRIIEEPPIGFDYLNDTYVEDRLESLGYLK